MEVCLFCNEVERNYKPGPDIEYICGGCVIMLADAGQADLKRAYQKALDKGYPGKVSAIESFIIREGEDEQRRPEFEKVGRYSNRAGVIKSLRNQKERIKRVAV